MFLEKVLQKNPDLIRYSIELHQSGRILPDTYVIDLDAVADNAQSMLSEANRYGVKLFFMTKQLGRNPIVSKELVRLGYEGAVAVDFKEAITLADNGIPIAHIGHLVQVPTGLIDRVIQMQPGFITVYSVEKAREINEACRKAGVRQDLLLRIIDRDDVIYNAQYGGFWFDDLENSMKELLKLSHVNVAGVTSFPCFLYQAQAGDIPTHNAETLKRAVRLLDEKFGIKIKHVNMPSATCTHSIRILHENGGTQGEPGHGLLGSTPMHADHELIERPAMVYVSEISHQLDDSSFCYGGGFYNRSQINEALVTGSPEQYRFGKVHSPPLDAIDYHIELEGKYAVGDSVIMAFRTQVFVTRSEVAIVKGLSEGNPQLMGIFDSQGRPLKEFA
jgi:predicted amino acid racemase